MENSRIVSTKRVHVKPLSGEKCEPYPDKTFDFGVFDALKLVAGGHNWSMMYSEFSPIIRFKKIIGSYEINFSGNVESDGSKVCFFSKELKFKQKTNLFPERNRECLLDKIKESFMKAEITALESFIEKERR